MTLWQHRYLVCLYYFINRGFVLVAYLQCVCIYVLYPYMMYIMVSFDPKLIG